MRLIRCNVGELAAVAGVNWAAKGVDSGSGKLDVVQTAKTVARDYNCLVIVTDHSEDPEAIELKQAIQTYTT